PAASAAVDRWGSRYTDAAYRSLVRQTAGWPTDVHVSLPDIHIDSVRVAADDSTAVLHTRETWRVVADGGRGLFAEPHQPHTITLRRLPRVVPHKGVVPDIRLPPCGPDRRRAPGQPAKHEHRSDRRRRVRPGRLRRPDPRHPAGARRHGRPGRHLTG